MPVWIDVPNSEIDETSFAIVGWVCGNSASSVVLVDVNGHAVANGFRERPDVASELPGFNFHIGIVAQFYLIDISPTNFVRVRLSFEGETAERTFAVATKVRETVVREQALRYRSSQWVLARLRCPTCAAPRTSFERKQIDSGPTTIVCQACASEYSQQSRAFNMISRKIEVSSRLAATNNVSANPYTPAVMTLIEETVAQDGWILDCGAGSRPFRYKNVINTEVVDYASTDVLAAGEALPFCDNTFDATISMTVLEHVRDPFACASELIRVTKPGGRIIADVPFLQPVHGYPDHYYNMTQAGLKNLFSSGTELLECYCPLHGHPIWMLQWILREYLKGLPADIAHQFGQRTLAEMAAEISHSFLGTPPAAMLRTDTKEALSCLNTIVVRKL